MEVPQEVRELGLRLEEWRSQQGGRRQKLPERFWREAARLGAQYGFSRVAGVLRLNASVLRSKSSSGRATPQTPKFVEVTLPMMAGATGECVLEMDTARGQKLRLEIKAMPVAALAQLIRAVAE